MYDRAHRLINEFGNNGFVAMPFEKGFAFVCGQKSLYFSAHINPETFQGHPMISVNGVSYINPKTMGENGHLMQAKIIPPEISPEALNAPSFRSEPSNFECDLAMNLSSHEAQKPINQITDEEAQQAGFRNPNKLRIMLALQSNKGEEFAETLKTAMEPALHLARTKLQEGYTVHTPDGQSTQIKFTGDQLDAVINNLRDTALQAMHRDIDPRLFTDPTSRGFVPHIIQMAAGNIDPATIPGKADVYDIRMAEPKKFVENGLYEDEAKAAKHVADSLRYFVWVLKRPHTPLTNDTNHYFDQKYGKTMLGKALDELTQRADALAPETKTRPPEVILKGQIEAAKKAGTLSSFNASMLLMETAKASGPHALAEVEKRFNAALKGEQGRSA